MVHSPLRRTRGRLPNSDDDDPYGVGSSGPAVPAGSGLTAPGPAEVASWRSATRPDAARIRTLLIKPGYMRGQVPNAPGRYAQSLRGKGIAQKIKPIADPYRKRLWVISKLAKQHSWLCSSHHKSAFLLNGDRGIITAMNSPILSGAMVLTLCSVCPERFTPAAPSGISIRPATSGIRWRSGHPPLSQTVRMTWPRSAYRTKQVWSSTRNVELDQNRSRRRRQLEEFGWELGVLHDSETMIK